MHLEDLPCSSLQAPGTIPFAAGIPGHFEGPPCSSWQGPSTGPVLFVASFRDILRVLHAAAYKLLARLLLRQVFRVMSKARVKKQFLSMKKSQILGHFEALKQGLFLPLGRDVFFVTMRLQDSSLSFLQLVKLKCRAPSSMQDHRIGDCCCFAFERIQRSSQLEVIKAAICITALFSLPQRLQHRKYEQLYIIYILVKTRRRSRCFFWGVLPHGGCAA